MMLPAPTAMFDAVKDMLEKYNGGAEGGTNAIGAQWGRTLRTIGLFGSNINTTIFTAWVMADLIPKLPPQSMSVMDNAALHKGVEVKHVIKTPDAPCLISRLTLQT